jgi:hypothetical protein
MLLDFRFDPRVAAYLARPTARDTERDDFEIYGAVYAVLQGLFPRKAFAWRTLEFPFATDKLSRPSF